jgi:DNA-binding CsgD family transcriptional regulator
MKRINADQYRSRAGKEFVPLELAKLISEADTERAAEAEIALDRLDRALTDREKLIALALGEGQSPQHIAQQHGVSRTVVRTFQKRLKRLRGLLPAPRPPVPADLPPRVGDYALDEMAPSPISGIDRALADLSRPTQGRKDCPVCWRCCWFLGLRPKRYVPSELSDDELRAAVRATERRKIDIAYGRTPT